MIITCKKAGCKKPRREYRKGKRPDNNLDQYKTLERKLKEIYGIRFRDSLPGRRPLCLSCLQDLWTFLGGRQRLLR